MLEDTLVPTNRAGVNGTRVVFKGGIWGWQELSPNATSWSEVGWGLSRELGVQRGFGGTGKFTLGFSGVQGAQWGAERHSRT